MDQQSPRSRTHERGFTMVEVFLAIAIAGLVFLAIAKLIPGTMTLFRKTQIRQQANLDARTCLETIKRLLSNAKASTIIINAAPAPPSSAINFSTIDDSDYAISWTGAPANTIHISRTKFRGTSQTTDTYVAKNVTGLIFSCDPQDPAIIKISLQLDTPLDSTGLTDAAHLYTILLTNQVVRMITTQ